MTKRKQLISFFEEYEANLNSAILGDAPGAAHAALAFGETFVDANEAGVECRRNDDSFVATIIASCDAYRRNGIRALRLEGIDSTPIDQDYVMARVHWIGEYRHGGDTDLRVPFDVVYLVHIVGPMKIYGRMAGDEQRAMRRHGLDPQ